MYKKKVKPVLIKTHHGKACFWSTHWTIFLFFLFTNIAAYIEKKKSSNKTLKKSEIPVDSALVKNWKNLREASRSYQALFSGNQICCSNDYVYLCFCKQSWQTHKKVDTKSCPRYNYALLLFKLFWYIFKY